MGREEGGPLPGAGTAGGQDPRQRAHSLVLGRAGLRAAARRTVDGRDAGPRPAGLADPWPFPDAGPLLVSWPVGDLPVARVGSLCRTPWAPGRLRLPPARACL